MCILALVCETQGLKRYGLDAFDRAIDNVSFSRRLMYMHAYQSFLFNKMASVRLRMFGAKLVEGDLVRDLETNGVVALSKEQALELNEESANPLALVILPLVGTNARYPTNEISSQYMKVRVIGVWDIIECCHGWLTNTVIA